MDPRLRAALTVALTTAILLAGLAWAYPASGQRLVNERLVESVGSSDMLGGGDYVFVRFGADAAFGVLWGNATNPNHVYMVALKARYLGVAQVVDTGGRVVADNVPVKYWTLYAVKLIDLVEFRDQDSDGIANYSRTYDNVTGNFTTFIEDEPIPKRVDLRTSWTRGAIARNATPTSRTWSFSLSAANLPYEGVNEVLQSRGDDVLNLVRFTFHLNASLEEVDSVVLRNWRVTVDTSGFRPVVTNTSRLDDVTWSGTVARYGLKWDQEIVGWDFEPGVPRRLLLEFAAIVGNLIPPGVANWIDGFAARENETGRARYESTRGNETVDNGTGSYTYSRRLASLSVDFEGDWSRVGRFAWVTDSRVDNATRPLYAQILAGHRIVARGELGGAFVGFVLFGALSYEGGNEIVHDPEVTTDVIAALSPPSGLGGILVAVGVAVAIVIVGLALVFFTRRRRATRPKP
ncbi:MAG: hypothetical protein ACT4OI_08225 [Methanobacteriota archaeon]